MRRLQKPRGCATACGQHKAYVSGGNQNSTQSPKQHADLWVTVNADFDFLTSLIVVFLDKR